MNRRLPPLLLTLALAGLLGATALAFKVNAAAPQPAAAARPALTVTVTRLQQMELPLRVSAAGNIAAWQEASVGTEIAGLRLAEVRVNVGDVVQRGQVLASFAPETVQANLAQIRASVAEAEAGLAEAAANAHRARELKATGALSEQQINQYLTAERTAQARLEAQRAAARVQQLRLGQTRLLAPDSGIISARSATVGAVPPPGQELFRMIRQGRLEWRAEVPSADLGRIRAGMPVKLQAEGGEPIEGKVRMVGPTVDAQTRNGLVYIDLGATSGARAGMFARGDIEVGSARGLALPQSAVQLRDGFTYVHRVGADGKVAETKVQIGRRFGDRIEIVGGLDPQANVVASGGGFLGDGDTVRVVQAAAAAASAARR